MTSQPEKPQRILSIDAYRGLVMLLMIGSGLQLYNVAKKFPDSPVWQSIGFHTNHVPWSGGSLHDMIQPGFSFLVGVALPFSIASRYAKGQGFARMLFHATWRALLLVALGIFLRSNGKPFTNFSFEDTLSQIGLGYVFLFLLGFVRPILARWIVFAIIVIGYWAFFALHPLPADFNYAAVGVPDNWPHHYEGFMAHWNKNSNAAWVFDQWFLNLFGREKTWEFNAGGYATLSFIPTLGTMILGLIAGTWMREATARGPLLLKLLLAGVILTAAGLGAEAAGICPIVKPIWTPAWTLYSGGICFFFLLGFTLLFDNGSPIRFLAFPLVVLGANSIFGYSGLNGLTAGWVRETLKTHLALPERHWDFKTYEVFGPEYETAVRGGLVILIFWFVLLWMYLKRIFVKI